MENRKFLKLPDDLHELPITLVVEGTPAWRVVKRLAQSETIRPGQMFPVTQEEMASFRRDVLRLNLVKGGPPAETGG